MEEYRDMLIYTISVISKIYLVVAVVIGIILVFGLIIKSKKVRNAMLVFLACILITYAILVVPRFYDLHNDSFVKVENASIIPDDFYTYSTDIMFFGHADIILSDGETIEVSGTDFFEFSSIEMEECYGDVVFAKYSRQLISIENYQ